MMRWAGRLSGVLGTIALLWLAGMSSAWAGQTSPSPTGAIDCTSFDTTEEAQTFYDDHKDDNASNPDPYGLDTDGDGTPCEGLRSAGGTATATPAPSASPTATPSGQLTETGAATGVMALSGFSLLELGYSLTLLARRWGVRSRQLPVYLLRKLVRARREGHDGIELADELVIVHKSVLEEQQEEPEPAQPEPLVEADPSIKIPGPSVYSQVARDAVERNGHR